MISKRLMVAGGGSEGEGGDAEDRSWWKRELCHEHIEL